MNCRIVGAARGAPSTLRLELQLTRAGYAYRPFPTGTTLRDVRRATGLTIPRPNLRRGDELPVIALAEHPTGAQPLVIVVALDHACHYRGATSSGTRVTSGVRSDDP